MSTSVAALQPRGLMELVILNLGLENGIITRPTFTMMELTAIVTTALTTLANGKPNARH